MDAISNLVFENKERLPSGFYLDIMNLLLKAHKQQERRPQGQSNGHNQPRPVHHPRPAHQPRSVQQPRPVQQQREMSDEAWIIHMDGVLNEFSSLSHLVQTLQERRHRQGQSSRATNQSRPDTTPRRTNGMPDMRFKCNKERYGNQVRSGSA